jgi:hypothetical protein
MDSTTPIRRWLCAGTLVVLAIVALAHAGGLTGQFVDWDDPTHVTQNPAIRELTAANLRTMFTQPIAKLYCPLTWLSLAVDYQIWGRDPWGYHLTNLLLHLANVGLVIGLIWKLPALDAKSSHRQLLTALLTGLLFGVHPLRVESVAWVTERKDLLFAFFYLAGLLFYLRSLRLGQRFALGACFGFATAAALSKSAGVTFPAVLVLLDVLHGRPWAWKTKIPFLLVSLAVTGTTILAQAGGRGDTVASTDAIPLWGRLGLVGYCALFYVVKTFWPFHLSAIYPVYEDLNYTPALATLHFCGLLLVTGLCLSLRKRAPVLLPAWLFYLVTLSPTIGLLPVGIHIVADRFAYLPAIGLVVPVALFAARSRAGVISVVLLGIGLAGLTRERTQVWQDTGTLFRSVLRENPNSLPAHLNLTVWHTRRNEFDQAIHHGATAVRLAPDSGYAVKNLAAAYLKADRPRDAVQLLRAPAEKEIHDPDLWRLLAEAFAALGDTDNAARARQRYVALSGSGSGAASFR